MTRIGFKFIVPAIVLLGALWALHHHWVRVNSVAWHLRHGRAVQIAEYVFPVPWNWYPQDTGNGTKVLARLDTEDRTAPERKKAHALIVLSPKVSNQDVDLQLAKRLEALKKSGVETVLQQDLNVYGDVISCIGGHKFDSYGMYDIDPVTWYCKSIGGLDMTLTATEVDLKEAWEIISHIERRQ